MNIPWNHSEQSLGNPFLKWYRDSGYIEGKTPVTWMGREEGKKRWKKKGREKREKTHTEDPYPLKRGGGENAFPTKKTTKSTLWLKTKATAPIWAKKQICSLKQTNLNQKYWSHQIENLTSNKWKDPKCPCNDDVPHHWHMVGRVYKIFKDIPRGHQPQGGGNYTLTFLNTWEGRGSMGQRGR